MRLLLSQRVVMDVLHFGVLVPDHKKDRCAQTQGMPRMHGGLGCSEFRILLRGVPIRTERTVSTEARRHDPRNATLLQFVAPIDVTADGAAALMAPIADMHRHIPMCTATC